jgi:toxin-antitoxin system PIN domain toxin
MRLPDVNVLVYAFREDAPGHREWRWWLEELVEGPEPFALSDRVLVGFLRVVTHPRVFDPPTPLDAALAFAEALRSRPNAVMVTPGPRHWEIFTRLSQESSARGNHLPDAWLAALAIEQGCAFITADRGFARFAGLRWSRPVG